MSYRHYNRLKPADKKEDSPSGPISHVVTQTVTIRRIQTEEEEAAFRKHLEKSQGKKDTRGKPANKAKHFYRLGNKHFDQQDFEKAVEFYTLSLEEDSSSADCFFNRANAYRNQGKLKEAIHDYTMALRIDNSDFTAHTKLGIAYSLLGGTSNLTLALNAFNAAIALRPDCAEAFVKRGNAFRDLQQWDSAFSDYTDCINITSDVNKTKHVAEAYANRAVVLVRRNRLQSAMSDLSKALALNPAKYDH